MAKKKKKRKRKQCKKLIVEVSTGIVSGTISALLVEAINRLMNH